MNASNNGYWVLVQMWILERLPKPGPRQQQIANRWPVKMNNLCYYSLGKNDNFPIFTDFCRFFLLSRDLLEVLGDFLGRERGGGP